MTRDEVLAMKPGSKLDLLVCEKVMKWKTPWEPFFPSTDISAAFEILDKFDGYEIKREPYTRRTEVRIYQFSNMRIHRAVGESVPDVACKAALLAVMSE